MKSLVISEHVRKHISIDLHCYGLTGFKAEVLITSWRSWLQYSSTQPIKNFSTLRHGPHNVKYICILHYCMSFCRTIARFAFCGTARKTHWTCFFENTPVDTAHTWLIRSLSDTFTISTCVHQPAAAEWASECGWKLPRPVDILIYRLIKNTYNLFFGLPSKQWWAFWINKYQSRCELCI